MLVRMTVPNGTSRNTVAFFLQAAIAFGVSLLTALGTVATHNPDPIAPRWRAAQVFRQERERLSREVHDGAIQVLALIAKRGA